MWNKPTDKQLAKIPALYSTEKISLKDKKVMMHFFLAGCDWYIVEYSPEERLFWGFAILNSDFDNAEWGYFSFDEIIDLKVSFACLDRDKHWQVRKAFDVDNIRKAQNW